MPRKKRTLVSKAQIAVALSAETGREISVRQVWAWVARQANSGFPNPKKTVLQRGRQTPLFDLEEVLRWHSTYVPKKGGPPFKNGKNYSRPSRNARAA
jgi:hypothetical protein